jgi:hypothetical protein
MTPADETRSAPALLQAIRPFDVFAEYSRQERLGKGYGEDEAKGYGIWLAEISSPAIWPHTDLTTLDVPEV